jgi:hypothetical protein
MGKVEASCGGLLTGLNHVLVNEVGLRLYKLNPVVTHSLNPKHMVSTLEPLKCDTFIPWFKVCFHKCMQLCTATTCTSRGKGSWRTKTGRCTRQRSPSSPWWGGKKKRIKHFTAKKINTLSLLLLLLLRR